VSTFKSKIVRAFWGDYSKRVDEIPLTPLFDETVFVWGDKNYEYLTSLGYKCEKMSSDDMRHYSVDEMFFLKPLAWKKACEMFGSILFLDWDVYIVKPLDNDFWNDFDEKKFSAPIYSYPKGIENEVWAEVLKKYLNKYSWEWDQFLVLPNAGLVYLDGIDTANQIVNIIENDKLKGLTEEFALYKLANCDLKTYLNLYEPKVINGRPDFHYFDIGKFKGYFSKKLNKYTGTQVKKDIYLIHN